MKACIDACVRRKGVFIFSLHSLLNEYGYDSDLLDQLLDYAINEKGMSMSDTSIHIKIET